jgi:hypothetical protein
MGSIIYAFLSWQDLEDRARMMKQRMKVMQGMRGSGMGSEYETSETHLADAWALGVDMLLCFSLVV